MVLKPSPEPGDLFARRWKELLELLFERTFFVYMSCGCYSDVEGLRDSEFLFASALGIDYFLLRGGSSDCVLLDGRIRSAGVAHPLTPGPGRVLSGGDGSEAQPRA
jgi:hypothetical protein